MPSIKRHKTVSREVHRGDIYYVDLNPAMGSEQGGIRPVLVIQNEMGNLFSPTVIVAPLTSRVETKNSMPTHYTLQAGSGGVPKPSVVLLEQIRVIDKSRLQGFVGSLAANEMKNVDDAIATSLGIKAGSSLQ